MKITPLGESLIITIVVIIATATAKAQNNSPQVPTSVLNGLFSPTAAQRFFEEGRRDFESQIQFLANPQLSFKGDLLKFDRNLKEQMVNPEISRNWQKDEEKITNFSLN